MGDRNPNVKERELMKKVFGNSLSDYHQIYIDGTYGLGSGPWTMYEEGGRISRFRWSRSWKIFMGPEAWSDCTTKKTIPGFGPVDEVFVHELTHVWQGSHDFFPDSFMKDSIVAQAVAAGALVEDWYKNGMNEAYNDLLWPYIKNHVRKGNSDRL
jgi:hypothetical protein